MKKFILTIIAFWWGMTAFCQDVPIKKFNEPQTFFNGAKHLGFFGASPLNHRHLTTST